MNKCEICNVLVVGKEGICPLCKNRLERKVKSENIFPKIPTVYESNKILFNILLLLSLLAALITIMINILIKTEVFWSIFVVLGLATSWFIVIFALSKRNNFVKLIFYQSLIISLLSILWDVLTGWHNWSIDYVVPITISVGLVATVVLSKVMNVHANDFLVYLLVEIILGFVPIIFFLTDILRETIPSLICILLTQTILVTIIILSGTNILKELRRRLHL